MYVEYFQAHEKNCNMGGFISQPCKFKLNISDTILRMFNLTKKNGGTSIQQMMRKYENWDEEIIIRNEKNEKHAMWYKI